MMRGRVLNGAVGLFSGLLFGLGLAVAQMTNPEKVIAFLDIADQWDPSLALTMAGAILVSVISFRVILRKGPVLAEKLHLPTRSDIDSRLIIGATLFGIGWALTGYCPGPAIAALTSGSTEPFVFLTALLAGSQLERLWMLKHPQTASSQG